MTFGTKAKNRKSWTNRQALYKECQSLFRDFHALTRHGAAPVNQENETELFPTSDFSFLRSFFWYNEILRLLRLKSRNKTCQASILVRHRIVLVFQLGSKHVFGLVENLDFAFRYLLRLLKFNAIARRCFRGDCIGRCANESYFITRLDFKIVVECVLGDQLS